jgi:hypothetical protein
LIGEHAEKSSKVPILGIVPPKGRYVIDIDTKKNVQALQLWKDRVIEAYGDASLGWPNLVVKTKSGGYHLYYSDGSDRLIHSPTNVFGAGSGVDIRGYTGMVVAPTFIGGDEDWQPGDYTIVRGTPVAKPTVLGLSKIVADFGDDGDDGLKYVLRTINEALRNDSINEFIRHRLLPNDLIIPSSSRDNTLYRCARLCRLAGISQDAAMVFMAHIAALCETSPEEPLEHWQKLASDKVRRVFSDDQEVRLKSVSAFFDEMDNAGAVLLRGVSKAYYYFRNGSAILRIDPRSKYSTENMGNVLQGVTIYGEEEAFPAKKSLGLYTPKEVAFEEAMFPKMGSPFFEYQGKRYVNTYHDPFAAFEPDRAIMERAAPYIDRFLEFAKYITGYEDGDDARLLDKLAWIVQKPYRRMPTGTIIYSHTKGSGKDSMMLLVREIVGQRYYAPITLKSLQDPHLLIHDKLVCVASEVQLQANARGSIAAASFIGDLKDLITAKHVSVNEKFVQAYSAPLYANIFILSNFELSSILEPGDRRWDIFHATEEKVDQRLFGELIDIGSDAIWYDRSDEDRLFRKHVVYAIRSMLKQRRVSDDMDRSEAVENVVKTILMESQNPPALNWMLANLPPYFTEDVAMMACHFSPMRSQPDYIIKQMKEHFGPQMRPIYRANRIVHRMNGAPKLELYSDGQTTVPKLNFELKTGDASARAAVYTLDNSLRDVNATDSVMKQSMRKWYEMMIHKFYGNVTTLPNQKPSGTG